MKTSLTSLSRLQTTVLRPTRMAASTTAVLPTKHRSCTRDLNQCYVNVRATKTANSVQSSHNSNEQQKTTQPLSFHLGEEAIGGFAAGVFGTLLGFPLDLVKTRMQTQVASSTMKLSPLSLLRHILQTEGLTSLYKGVGPPLLSLSIVNTLS